MRCAWHLIRAAALCERLQLLGYCVTCQLARLLLPRALVKLRCCDVRVRLAVRLCEHKVTLRESAAWTHLDQRTVKRGQRLAREAQLQQKCQLARWRWRGCAAAVLRTHTCRSNTDAAVRLVR